MAELTIEQKKAMALASARARAAATTPRSAEEVNKEFEAMPWYSKLGTAADDLVRIGADGISFGGLDRLLGPEAQKLTDEARIRAGWAGTAADVGGMVASPVSRTVGMAGKAASKLAPGLLGRMGIAAAEGGALGATDAAIRGKDIKEGATTGAAISAAIPVVGKALARTGAFVQGTKPGSLEEAFVSGERGGSTSKAFRQGQRGQHMTDAKGDFAAAENSWSTGPVDPKKLKQAVADIRKEVVTPTGLSKLEAADKRAFDQMNTVILKGLKRGSNVQNMDAIRRQIDAWADGTEMQKMMATRLKEAIRQSVEKVQPGYVDDLSAYANAKKAHAAGKELNDVFPKGGLLGHLAQTAVVGSSVIGAPIVGPGVLAAGPMFSPKISGLIANILGEITGRTGTHAGIAAPVWSGYNENKKRERKARRLRE